MPRTCLRLAAFAVALVGLLAVPTGARADDDPARDKAAEAEKAKKVADLCERFKANEADARLSAAMEAKDVQDPKVTAALAHAVSDADADVRKASIAALAVRTDDAAKKQAATALAARLTRLRTAPAMQEELLAALAALHDLAQPSTVRALAEGLDVDSTTDAKLMDAWTHAIGNIPSAEAIESLIDFLAREGRGRQWWGRSTVAGLTYATGEKWGGDPDVWRKWWREHKQTFDFQAAAARRAKERQDAKDREERLAKAKAARDAAGMGEGGMGDGKGGMGDGGMDGGGMGDGKGGMDEGGMGDGGMGGDAPPPSMDA